MHDRVPAQLGGVGLGRSERKERVFGPTIWKGFQAGRLAREFHPSNIIINHSFSGGGLQNILDEFQLMFACHVMWGMRREGSDIAKGLG